MSAFDARGFVASLPRRPGVYRMFAADGLLLYVGKAKSLRDRVGSYFVPSNMHPKVQALWESITPLAKNEWICWVTSGKRAETRGIRIEKAISKLKGGMRRPCCWAGCPHR